MTRSARIGSFKQMITVTARRRKVCWITPGNSLVIKRSIIAVSHVTVLISSPDVLRESVLTDIFSILSNTMRRRSTIRPHPASITARFRSDWKRYEDSPSAAIRRTVRQKPRKTAPPSPARTDAFAVSLSIYPSTRRRFTYGPSKLTAKITKYSSIETMIHVLYGTASLITLLISDERLVHFMHVFIPGRSLLPHFGQTRGASPSAGAFFPVSRNRVNRRVAFAIASALVHDERQITTGPSSVSAHISHAPTSGTYSNSFASESSTERTGIPPSKAKTPSSVMTAAPSAASPLRSRS